MKAAEGKVETAEQLGKEAEEKPLPEQARSAILQRSAQESHASYSSCEQCQEEPAVPQAGSM